MGKRKRSGGQGFGRPKKPPGLGKEFSFDDFLNGEQVLIASPVMDPVKGIGDCFTLFPYQEISERLPSLQKIIDALLTPNLVYLARRRQLEEGKGLFTFTPKEYRQQWREVNETDGEIIFNWWTLPEIKVAPDRSEIFGGTRIFSILSESLILDSKNRFPIILHAVPLGDDNEIFDKELNLKYAHTMFTASLDPERILKDRKNYFIERETIPLTDFIPNAVNAVVDIRKLRDYCLNTTHAQGKHKARLFSSILGLTVDDAEELQQILLEIVTAYKAQPGRADEFGTRYTIDFMMQWKDRNAEIRSGWIIEKDSDIPRLTTCYPL